MKVNTDVKRELLTFISCLMIPALASRGIVTEVGSFCCRIIFTTFRFSVAGQSRYQRCQEEKNEDNGVMNSCFKIALLFNRTLGIPWNELM